MARNRGKIISLFGVKGGVGQTTLSVNLAIALQKTTREKVAFVHLDLAKIGEISLVLGPSGSLSGGQTGPGLTDLPSNKSLADIIPLIDKLNPEILEGYLISHPSGIDILPAVLTPNQIPQISPARIAKFLSLLQKIYDWILLDLEKQFTENTIGCLENSLLVLLLLTPDLLAIQQTKQILVKLKSLHFPDILFKIILNFADLKGGIPPKQIVKNLSRDIFAQIPFDPPAVANSINTSTPALLENPHSRFSRGIYQLSTNLTREPNLFTEPSKLTRPKPPAEPTPIPKKTQEENEKWLKLKLALHQKLLDQLHFTEIDLQELGKSEPIKQHAQRQIEHIIAEDENLGLSRLEREVLAKEVLAEAVGLGPLEDLLADPTVTEILVNGKDKIYAERHGKLTRTNRKFLNEEQVYNIINRILAPLGRRVDESSPVVDTRLKDGSRVNIIIPPLSTIGPTLSIRKFPQQRLTMNDLLGLGALSPQMLEFLRSCVQLRKNIVISGGTSSGKTTLLNILASYIDSEERIITIEDTVELRLPQEHAVTLESRPPNIEGKGQVTIRQLVINALHMRPDRIIVGECRSDETFDMLQAMNTGHDGSLTTVHANSPLDALSRLESMVLLSNVNLPDKVIRELLKSAIDLIIHQQRFPDGSRKIIAIDEVTGIKDGTITLSEIFRFKQTGVDRDRKIVGHFEATGVMSTFIDQIKSHGIKLNLEIFQK